MRKKTVIKGSFKIQDFPAYEKNPFDPEGIFERVKKSGGKETVVYNDDGEAFILKHAIKFEGKFVKDYRSYRKLYVQELVRVKNLSAPGLRLFCFILINLEKCVDIIRIDIKGAMAFCDYKSMSQYYAGLFDLLKNDFIVRRMDDRSTFFINVNVFFNGDRSKLLEKSEEEPKI